MALNYLEVLQFAGTEAILVVAALLVLTVDLFVATGEEHRVRLGLAAIVSGFGCFAALFWMFMGAPEGDPFRGMIVLDPLTAWVKAGIIVLTAAVSLVSAAALDSEHVGEFFALLLLGAVGMLFMASAENLLMIFLALELSSLSLYLLTAYARTAVSTEAALKYFLFGGMAAAFALFGISLLYGLTGSLELQRIGGLLGRQPLDPLVGLALVMVTVGFGFKIAAAPFHLWAPDAYQVAPAPSAAWIASGSKLASFYLFGKVLLLGFGGIAGNAQWRAYQSGWLPVIAVLALLSMTIGNFGALAQTNVRRLLAYSAVAHAGYALVGLTAANGEAMTAVVYYLVTYGLTLVGAIGVMSLLEARRGAAVADLAGLSREEPWLSAAMFVFILSLVGVPPLAGFFGKFYLFAAALRSPGHFGMVWLVLAAVGLSAVSIYYYLQVLKQIYVSDPPVKSNPDRAVPWLGRAVVVLLAAVVLVLGAFPDLLTGPLEQAVARTDLGVKPK